ncbi:hypothetical protein BH10PSE7_BH10PSE7_38320 [soil metagenome]
MGDCSTGNSASYGQRGTTLVELVIAMALLALIAVYSLGAVKSFRDFARVADRIEHQELAGAVATHLVRSIESARGAFVSGTGDLPVLAFIGQAQSLTIVTDSDPRLDFGGLYLVQLTLEDAGEYGLRLVDRRTAFRPSLMLDLNTGDPVVLLDHIRRLTFAYYGSASSNEAARWHGDWLAAARMPAAVRILIDLDNRPSGISLIIPLSGRTS